MPAIRAEEIRAPSVAGMFYPADADNLRHEVEKLLELAHPEYPQKPIVAAIAPHAGYIYSGAVAAYTFKALQTGFSLAAEKFSPTVVVIAPSHREAFPFVSVFTGKSYRTPLGEVPIAHELANALIASDANILADWRGHHVEHALEVELPFLQVIWPDFRLVPVVMGDQNWKMCRLLGEQLANLAQKPFGASASPIFILASSDLSHYYSYDEAVSIDERFIKHLQAFDPATLHGALEIEECQACGGGPVVAAMIAAKSLGADAVDILCYQNSGDVSGDRDAVVGYLAAVFARSKS